MKNFTVIIPTMYKVPYLPETLEQLVKIDSVHEIVVIENSQPAFAKVYDPKIIYIGVFENVGCNPAWNMGVKLAKCDYICLLSDDILFDFHSVLSHLASDNHSFMDDIGILGLAADCYGDIPDNTMFQMVPSGWRGFGFGSCMFMKKDNYVPVPEDLKICWGDEWLYKKQTKPNYELSNLPTNKAVGLTSGQDSLDNMRNNDTILWQTKYHFL